MAIFYCYKLLCPWTVLFSLMMMAVLATANLNSSQPTPMAKSEPEAFMNQAEELTFVDVESPPELKQHHLNHDDKSVSQIDFNKFIRQLQNLLKALHRLEGTKEETLRGRKEEYSFENDEQPPLIRTLVTLLHYNRTDYDLPRGRRPHAGRRIKTNVNILTDPAYPRLILKVNLILGLIFFVFLIAVFICDAMIISKEAWTRSNAVSVRRLKKQRAEDEEASSCEP